MLHIKRLLSTFCYGVGVRRTEGEAPMASPMPFQTLLPNWKYWYADPILAQIDGKTYLFMEQFDRIKDIGRIAVSEITGSGQIGKPRTVLTEPFHLSFPNVFSWQNAWYMLPECSADGSIRLYKMGSTVDEWRLIARREVGNCVDTAVWLGDEGMFLLTSELCPEQSLLTRLRLFSVRNLETLEWEECTDSLTDNLFTPDSRSGGNFFYSGNEFFRPVQCSTETYYGKFLRLHQVITVSEQGFSEQPVQEITDSQLSLRRRGTLFRTSGIHTYGRAGVYETVDFNGNYVSLQNTLRGVVRLLQGRGLE